MSRLADLARFTPAALFTALALVSTPTRAETTAIKLGRLVDGGGGVQENVVVVVEDTRIVSVSKDAAPAGARVIDLTAYTGIPGLIDVHTHMTYGPDPLLRAGRSTAVNMALGQGALTKTLESGVTTVRDMNAAEYADVSMRDLVNMGHWIGPRMFVVGCGLRATRTRFDPVGPPLTCGEGNGASEFARAARQQIAAGVDWIKVFGSTGTGEDVTGFQTATYEEMKAAVDVAHAAGERRRGSALADHLSQCLAQLLVLAVIDRAVDE